MKTPEIISALRDIFSALSENGVTYHQYATEMTYVLFLQRLDDLNKQSEITTNIKNLEELRDLEEKNHEETLYLLEKEEIVSYSWDILQSKTGLELLNYYQKILRLLGFHCQGQFETFYREANSCIQEPKHLKNMLDAIHHLAPDNGEFGAFFEEFLEKSVNEKKSKAGEYFTPRVLIDMMTRLVDPKTGERCNDPACGSFGFMISANQHVLGENDYFQWTDEQWNFHNHEAFTGCEIVPGTHRLAIMNAMLHKISGEISLADTLSSDKHHINRFDVVLCNPPFGTLAGGASAKRTDFVYKTSNKELNFLQHIYRSLNTNGNARAAVIMPDTALDSLGGSVLKDLMNKCNLHTVLRLPTTTFSNRSLKVNVLFFTRGTTDTGNTTDVWFYDLRTEMPSFGKNTPLESSHFAGFEAAYTAEDRNSIVDTRWTKFTREEIENNGNSLDLGHVSIDPSVFKNPVVSGKEIVDSLQSAAILIEEVVTELTKLGIQEE